VLGSESSLCKVSEWAADGLEHALRMAHELIEELLRIGLERIER
jgi:hypothetical protein